MKRVTLRERGRIHRLRPGRTPGEDGPDACWLEARVFDRLLAYDRSRGDGSIFDWRVDEARAGQWVGVVQVPGLLLELLPKIDSTGDDLEDGITLARDNLLVMLGEAGDVPLRSRDLADLGTRKAPLHETLITLFARRLRFELLRGADRGYVGEVDDLRLMRGKLVIGRHVARNAARRERFTCAFDEFTTNTELSRVLKQPAGRCWSEPGRVKPTKH
jgi:McrBC 5-methylcytosine restriction system component